MARDRVASPYIHPTDAPDGRGGALRVSVANGAASAVDIDVDAVGGKSIAPDDAVVSVINLTDGVDRTADVMLIKAGAIQLSGATTNAKKLQVMWLDQLPG